MRTILFVIAALLVASGPVVADAHPDNGLTGEGPSPLLGYSVSRSLDPPGSVAFETRVESDLKIAGQRLRALPDGPPASLRRPPSLQAASSRGSEYSNGEGSSKNKYLPVLLSALVPGAGELYMGYTKRAIVLMAVEVGAWSGYFYKRDQGLDTRAEYEAFADAYWDKQRFIDNHYLVYPSEGFTLELLEQEGKDVSGSGVWPGFSPWVSREEDKQHYYENIGKYDWYVSGWEDYVPGMKPDDLEPGEVLSLLREDYRELRRESNDQLDTANRFIYLSIAARVISLVQTTILVNRSPDEDEGHASADNRWMFRTRSRGPAAGEVALEYWFK